MPRVRVTFPERARRGEVITVRALAQHAMETGFRHNQHGERIARDIIRSFVCAYNGVEVFRATLHPATAANPLIAFTTVATESGTLEFRWTGDHGYAASHSARITVD